MKLDPYKYKNIIFDLGGVLLNIDYKLTIEAFRALGIANIDQIYSQAKQQNFFDKYETGSITTDAFRSELNALCDNKLSNQQIDSAWNALLLDLPLERLNILKKINSNHRIFLLSNTTELHILAFNSYLNKTLLVDNFYDYFEKVYLSYKTGFRKPNPAIFRLVLDENKLIAEETLFIDDSIQHIESASKLGITSYWLDISNESIEDIFI